MHKKKEKSVPVITVPKGYSLLELVDIDDNDFNEEPLVKEEVKVEYE